MRTYEEVETRLYKELGEYAEGVWIQGGKAAVCHKIGRRGREMSKQLLGATFSMHPSLLGDYLLPVYPVRRGSDTRLKSVVHLNRDEAMEVYDDLAKHEAGYARHAKAMLGVIETCNGTWEQDPNLTVEEVQARLFPSAAE